MTVTFDARSQFVYTQNNKGQRSVGSKVGLETNARTDMTNFIIFLDNAYRQENKIGRNRGVVGRWRGGTASPTFFDREDASPLPHFFWTEIRAEVSPLLQLVTYWNAV